MVTELIEKYEQRLDAYMEEIEEYCSKKRGTPLPISQSYLNEVLMPTFEALASVLPKGYGKLKVPDPATYRPIKEYYRIKVGLQTVGGFLVPCGEDFSLYFVPLKSALPIGDRVKIENIEQLSTLIVEWIKKK